MFLGSQNSKIPLHTEETDAKERGATDQRQKEQLMEQGPGRDGNE